MQEAADDLVSLYKRVSLDDDLDDALRSELLSQLSAGLPYLSTFFNKKRNSFKAKVHFNLDSPITQRHFAFTSILPKILPSNEKALFV